MSNRICLQCKKIKSAEDFHRDRSRKSGRSPYCKQCQKARLSVYDRTTKGNAAKKLRRSRFQKTTRGRFWILVSAAQRKATPLGITYEMYEALTSTGCTYCGGPLPRTGHGLDRLDNSVGYVPENVVACCDWCNVARSDHFTYEEMVKFIGPAIRALRMSRLKGIAMSTLTA